MLVILGLLVGGVLSGKSLIRAAEIRATIAQVDSLRVAARTFREKYFSLPGDIPTATATRLGLPWSTYGNNDGLISAISDTFANGEGNLFFLHLSQKGFIPGSYLMLDGNDDTNSNGKTVSDYLPKAKLGNSSYLYVWSGGPDKAHPGATVPGTDGYNYISIDVISRYCGINICGSWGATGTLPVMDAYVMDAKTDDGMPQSGTVQAFYLRQGSAGEWAGGEYSGRGMHTANSPLPATTANPATSVNCYDNGNVAGQPQRYTVSLNNNTCALSFRM